MAVEIAAGFDMLGDLLRDAAKWRSKVRAFFFSAARLITPLVFPAHVSPYTRRMNE